MKGKDIFLGLQYVGEDLIELAEYGRFPSGGAKKAGTGRLKRSLTVAAIIALMLLLMGCAAVLLMHLEDLRIGEETYVENMRYREDGSKIPATEKVKQFICIAGPEGSRNQLAAKEWLDFKQSYDPDGSLRAGAADFEKPALYDDYTDAYTQEMLDKIDEICRKYDLLPAGDAVIFQQGDQALLAQTLGFEHVVKPDSGLTLEFGGARVSACGNFNIACQATLQNPQAGEDYTFTLIYDYRDKAYFSSGYLIIEDEEAVQQWNCTLPDGTEVLIVSDKGGDAYILRDREDAFVDITIRNVGWNWDSPGDVMSRADMERIAEALDYSLKPRKVEDTVRLQARLEEAYQTRQNQEEDPAEVERRRQLLEENERLDSYEDLICRMRDNESYFTDYCSVAYEHFWDTMEYTLLDVTVDGEEELILGREGHIHAIWTIREGKTDRVASSYDGGYLCGGNVYEDYVFLDGKPYHWYFRINTDGRLEQLMEVNYDTYSGSWMLDESEDGTGSTPISEEQAAQIIDSFVRIPLEMKSVQAFPMN